VFYDEDCDFEDAQLIASIVRDGRISASHSIADLAGSSEARLSAQYKYKTDFRKEASKFKPFPPDRIPAKRQAIVEPIKITVFRRLIELKAHEDARNNLPLDFRVSQTFIRDSLKYGSIEDLYKCMQIANSHPIYSRLIPQIMHRIANFKEE